MTNSRSTKWTHAVLVEEPQEVDLATNGGVCGGAQLLVGDGGMGALEEVMV